MKIRLKEIAEKQGYNMSSLSRKADVSFSTVRRLWLNPTTPFTSDVLERLVRTLDCTFDELLSLDDES